MVREKKFKLFSRHDCDGWYFSQKSFANCLNNTDTRWNNSFYNQVAFSTVFCYVWKCKSRNSFELILKLDNDQSEAEF